MGERDLSVEPLKFKIVNSLTKQPSHTLLEKRSKSYIDTIEFFNSVGLYIPGASNYMPIIKPKELVNVAAVASHHNLHTKNLSSQYYSLRASMDHDLEV